MTRTQAQLRNPSRLRRSRRFALRMLPAVDLRTKRRCRMRGVQHVYAFHSCTGMGDTVRCTYAIIRGVRIDMFLFADQRPQPGLSDYVPSGTHRTRASPQSPWSTAARLIDCAAFYNAPPPNSLYCSTMIEGRGESPSFDDPGV